MRKTNSKLVDFWIVHQKDNWLDLTSWLDWKEEFDVNKNKQDLQNIWQQVEWKEEHLMASWGWENHACKRQDGMNHARARCHKVLKRHHSKPRFVDAASTTTVLTKVSVQILDLSTLVLNVDER